MFEITIFTIVWGAVIGVLVSAPMGPTGILVIQRTLNKGRLPGLLTGLGASLSDFFYAVITVFFLGLVVDWLDQYESTLQFVGSLAIASGILKNFLSGFGITVSNPFIIFFFIALFARTNFLFAASTKNWWLYIVGFVSLISGAVGWWFLITWVVNKVRNNFGVRTLRNINHGIALIMFGIALFGFGNGFYYLFINK